MRNCAGKNNMKRIRISKERTSFNNTYWHKDCGGILKRKDNKYKCDKCKKLI